MKFKFLIVAFCLALTSSTLLATTQIFDLTWSGSTTFIQNQYGGSGTGASATGQLTLDLDLLSLAPPTPSGAYTLSILDNDNVVQPNPLSPVVSFKMTITEPGPVVTTFTLSDFVAVEGNFLFDTVSTPFNQPPLSNLDLSYGSDLIGQFLSNSYAFGTPGVGIVAGDFVFSSGTNTSLPSKTSDSFIMQTENGYYLQPTHIVAIPEPSPALTVIMTLALCGGVLALRSSRRGAACR